MCNTATQDKGIKMNNLWNNPGVPHKGWTELTVDDLEEATHCCEMCGKEEIRYVHVMSHPEHENLSVGFVCAERMSNDYVRSKENLKQARLLSTNKRNWFNKTQWRKSSIIDGYLRETRTIIARAENYRAGVHIWTIKTKNGHQHSGLAYNLEDAKKRAEQAVKSLQIMR
jgi:hypothetical protein